jgi:hypothetical protein
MNAAAGPVRTRSSMVSHLNQFEHKRLLVWYNMALEWPCYPLQNPKDREFSYETVS